MPDFLKPYYNKENISYTTCTSLLIQKEIYLQKASYATYKHIGFKLYLQAGSCTCLKLKEEEKIEKLFLELEQFFEMIVAEKVGWDAMETRAENFNHWENQPNPGKSTGL